MNPLITYILQKVRKKIFTTPLGDVNASDNISDNPNDLMTSIYSIDAMNERRIEIFEIKSNQKK